MIRPSHRAAATAQPLDLSLPHLLDIWALDDDAARALPALRHYVAPRCAMTLDPDEIDVTGIRDPSGVGVAADMPLLYCESAQPHVDLMHPAWTAILVLRSAGHRLGLIDFQPTKPGLCDEYAPGTARAVNVLAPGMIVLMSDHHTHWLDAAPDESRFVGIALEYETRPTRADVEARLERILAAHGFPVRLGAAAAATGP